MACRPANPKQIIRAGHGDIRPPVHPGVAGGSEHPSNKTYINRGLLHSGRMAGRCGLCTSPLDAKSQAPLCLRAVRCAARHAGNRGNCSWTLQLRFSSATQLAPVSRMRAGRRDCVPHLPSAHWGGPVIGRRRAACPPSGSGSPSAYVPETGSVAPGCGLNALAPRSPRYTLPVARLLWWRGSPSSLT